jgi:hypothetical protein
MEELFVYSRLKRGLAFHYRLEQATLVGTAVSVDAVCVRRAPRSRKRSTHGAA